MEFVKLVSGRDCGLGSRHPLAFAGQLWHRVIVNREQVGRVARKLGLEPGACRGVVRLLKAFGRVPSAERLAVIAQLDPGYDDRDVGEVFGMNAAWSASVRRDADLIRKAEPVPIRLEWYDEGLKPFDPSPEEIRRRALEVRLVKGMDPRNAQPGIRAYTWRPRVSSFVQIRVD